MAKITKRRVDNARATKGGSKSGELIWDSEIPGFGLRVYPSGRKAYILQYRLQSGRQRRLLLGKHGVITAETARRRARQLLADVAGGNDPALKRDEVRSADNFRTYAEAFLEDLAKRGGRPSTIAEWQRLLRKHVYPAIGGLRIPAVDTEPVRQLHTRMKKTPGMANRVLSLISTILNQAERDDLRPLGSNPCRRISRYQESGRGRALTGEELERLGEVLAQAEREASVHPSALLAIRLSLLTGMRRSEILGAPFRSRQTEWAGLRWEYVDLEHGVIHLPQDKAGGGRTVPLSSAASELLAMAQRKAGNPYVCWGKGAGPFVGIDRPRRQLFAAAGIEGANFHSLRHTHGTMGGNLGLNSYLLAKLLGHRDERTSARYVHIADDPTREAAERVAEAIVSRLTRSPLATVSPLTPRLAKETHGSTKRRA